MDCGPYIKNPESETLLAGNSENGVEGVSTLPDRLNRYAGAHRRALAMSEYLILRKELKLAFALQRCGHWLLFHHYYTEDRLRLAGADFCKKHLLCPLCAVRRGAKYLKAYLQKLEVVLKAYPGLTPYMVTFTVANGPDLYERSTHLRQSMKCQTRARRNYLAGRGPHVEFAKAVGGVHSIEAKRGANSGEWHPHAHMIWLCREVPDPFKLSVEWKEFTGDSCVIDVRSMYGQQGIVGGFMEVFKYALKFSELHLEDNWDAFQVLAGSRLIDAFGVLRGVKVPEELTDDLPDDLPYIEMMYGWLQGGGYTLLRYQEILPKLFGNSG